MRDGGWDVLERDKEVQTFIDINSLKAGETNRDCEINDQENKS